MHNVNILEQELTWLDGIIQNAIAAYFQKENQPLSPQKYFALEGSFYGDFIHKHELNHQEQKVVTLALAAHIKPEILDIFLTKNKLYDMPFTEFGGVVNSSVNSFMPTIQTALFLLCGNNRSQYIKVRKLFDSQSKLFSRQILKRNQESDETNIIHSKLDLTQESLYEILYGQEFSYAYSAHFPASLLTTEYEWEDLVLSDFTQKHLDELDMWLNYGSKLRDEWQMSKSINGGYKALFYGPSGTGKTLTATLIGKKFNKKVYRINLSQLVSKYVGETEKNLEKIFEGAKNRDWILFFDEADALFSKRTSVSSSNDKYANQETAYLLQKVEESQNLIILASNLKDNFDHAFLRRFQSIIYFPIPDENERLRLWQKSFSPKANLDNIDLEMIANKYELSGANIVNVVRLSSLMALNRGEEQIQMDDIIHGIRREKYKEGKIV